MRKASELSGKAIVAYDTGAAFATVQDLIFDPQSHLLHAVVVDERHWPGSLRALPLSSIQVIGADALMTASRELVIPLERLIADQQIRQCRSLSKGMRVMTSDGRELGALQDLWFDERTAAILSYVVADRSSTGEELLALPAEALKAGASISFIATEVYAMLKRRSAGSADLIERQHESTSMEPAMQHIQTHSSTLLPAVVSLDAQRQKAYIAGKTARWEVLRPDGTPLIQQGEVATADIIDAAEQLQLLEMLYWATGGKLGRQTGLAAQPPHPPHPALEQALGRRVRWPVRGSRGRIIAAPGQVVTQQILELAHTHQKEQELLAAVDVLPVGQTALDDDERAPEAEWSTPQTRERVRNFWQRVKERVHERRQRGPKQDRSREVGGE